MAIRGAYYRTRKAVQHITDKQKLTSYNISQNTFPSVFHFNLQNQSIYDYLVDNPKAVKLLTLKLSLKC
jgi:hypothetical protein